MFQAKTIIEPFQIKSVEPLEPLSREDRLKALKRAEFNLFKLQSNEVLIDLLTDSGTSAMSAEQWAALQRGDESYAGSRSFQRFEDSVKKLCSMKHVIPTHQGRAAERILFSVLSSRSSSRKLKVPNNSHFDTTRANAEAMGFEALDFPCREFYDFESDFRFKGNMDLEALAGFLESSSLEESPVGFMTLTNNSCGGQPASLENIEAVAQLYKKKGMRFYIDACRIAENAAFIHKHERPDISPREIAEKIFKLADGCTFSAKKDAFVNIGGFLATNDESLVDDMKTLLILTEGFPTYGGLAGRDLEAIAQGLEEIFELPYLEYRLAVTSYISERLSRMEVPHLKPAGGHAIYLDAKQICSHLEPSDYPGQGLALSLYLEGGLRSCEIGSLMFGLQPDGSEEPHSVELVRLAIPRRVYTQSHMDYVLELIEYVYRSRSKIQPVRILKQPKQLRHFSASFSW